MATVVGNFILSKQYVGESGNGSITMVDLETGSPFKVTLQGGSLDESAFHSKAPVALEIEGFEVRKGDKGDYAVCTAIHAPTGKGRAQSS